MLGNLNILNKQVLEISGLKHSEPEKEVESSDYEAYSFKVNNKQVRYRHAKITPNKLGQFVTIWKRVGKNPIQPYDSSDNVELLLVTVKYKENYGCFVFPKSELCRQGVFSMNGKGGKRAIRVYPPWDKPQSKQAQKTQNWQLAFFAEIPENKSIDVKKFKSLFSAQSDNINVI
jgi:hypothetical protein